MCSYLSTEIGRVEQGFAVKLEKAHTKTSKLQNEAEHVCVCVYIYIYTHVCIYVCMSVYIHIYIYICMFV